MSPLLKAAAQTASAAALAGTILPALFFIGDAMPLDAVKFWMLASTVVWFATAPLWMD